MDADYLLHFKKRMEDPFDLRWDDRLFCWIIVGSNQYFHPDSYERGFDVIQAEVANMLEMPFEDIQFWHVSKNKPMQILTESELYDDYEKWEDRNTLIPKRTMELGEVVLIDHTITWYRRDERCNRDWVLTPFKKAEDWRLARQFLNARAEQHQEVELVTG